MCIVWLASFSFLVIIAPISQKDLCITLAISLNDLFPLQSRITYSSFSFLFNNQVEMAYDQVHSDDCILRNLDYAYWFLVIQWNKISNSMFSLASWLTRWDKGGYSSLKVNSWEIIISGGRIMTLKVIVLYWLPTIGKAYRRQKHTATDPVYINAL